MEIRNRLDFDIQLADWNKLAGLGRVRSANDVNDLFFPSVEPDAEPCPSSTRRRDFLVTIGDLTYYSLYKLVLCDPTRRFVDIQTLLRTTKQEGKLMSIVMSHVGQWMNQEPTKVVDRDNNKPALRRDLVPSLQKKYGEEAEEKSKALQQSILDHVRHNAKDFTSLMTEHYLYEYPNGHSDAYAARFKHAVWQSLLCLVLDFAGPNLQHNCMARFNSGEFRTSTLESSSTIAHTARDMICRIPEVARNPALQSASAADRLCTMMKPVIAQWVSEQCAEALERHGGEWQAPMIELVKAERAKSEALLKELYLPLPQRHSAPLKLLPLLDQAREGDDGDERLRRSHTHGSVNERSSGKPKSHRQTPISDAGESQPFNSSSLTADRLHNLRKLHRTKKVVTQQPELQAHTTSANPNLVQQTDDKRPCEPYIITGSKHWRRKAIASYNNK